MKPSGVGGQAVMEGVMMKHGNDYAVAIRKPNGEMLVEKDTYVSKKEQNALFRLPILRGIVTFIESLVLGMKTLTFSSNVLEEAEELQAGKEKSKKSEAILTAVTILGSIFLAVAIFMLLPFRIVQLFANVITSSIVLAILEGIVRLCIFLGYILAIAQIQDIKRVFMYHGAEHKVINCIEQGQNLTVANVKKQSRYHKRCGTNFVTIVMLISILFFIFIQTETIWLRYVLRILLIPIISGLSYEVILLAGKEESGIASILSKPGIWIQHLTTKEPDHEMIETAICSLEAVFDWKQFQEEQFGKKQKNKTEKEENNNSKSVEEDVVAKESKEKKEPLLTKIQVFESRSEMSATTNQKVVEEDEEEDDVLKSLNQYLNQTKEELEKDTEEKSSKKKRK